MRLVSYDGIDSATKSNNRTDQSSHYGAFNGNERDRRQLPSNQHVWTVLTCRSTRPHRLTEGWRMTPITVWLSVIIKKLSGRGTLIFCLQKTLPLTFGYNWQFSHYAKVPETGNATLVDNVEFYWSNSKLGVVRSMRLWPCVRKKIWWEFLVCCLMWPPRPVRTTHSTHTSHRDRQ